MIRWRGTPEQLQFVDHSLSAKLKIIFLTSVGVCRLAFQGITLILANSM
jgi:hypothetical protein